MEMGKPQKRRKQRKRRQQRRKQSTAEASTAAEANSKVVCAALGAAQLSTEIWTRTYNTLLQWHQAQVRKLCGGQLRRVKAESCSEEELEEDDEEDEEESCEEQALQPQDIEKEEQQFEEVDEEYLKFLEITLRHQEELKRSREAAALASTEA